MSFEEAINGVPVELARQGWRLRSSYSDSFLRRWERCGTKDTRHEWQHAVVTSDEWESASVVRPISTARKHLVLEAGYSSDTALYAHAGWGEGLAPTPETVKVWPYWWLVTIDGESLYPANLTIHGDVLASDGLHIQWLENPQWRGPVLPPMEAT